MLKQLAKDYEEFTFFENRFGFGPFSFYWVLAALTSIIGLLFFTRKLRKSWVLSLLVLLLINQELIMLAITSMNRDYLPASWSASYDPAYNILKLFLFVIIILLAYLWLAKRKKLPYPSAWIR